jgi:hypothetical protein
MLARLDRAAERLTRLGGERGALLLVDELELLDGEGLAALSFLIRGQGTPRVLWCIASGGGRQLPQATRAWLESLRDRPGVKVMTLDELTPAERILFVRSALPAGAPDDVVEGLARACGGSPAVLSAALEHLVATGRIWVAPDGSVRTSEDVAESAPKDLAELGPSLLQSVGEPERFALELLAASQGEAEAGVLAGAAGLEAGVLVDRLGGGPAAGVLSVRKAEHTWMLGFQHRSVGHSILEELGAGREREVHDHLADALERFSAAGEKERALHVAWHRLQGASPSDGVAPALQALRKGAAEGQEELGLQVAGLAVRHAQGHDKTALLEAYGEMRSRRGEFQKMPAWRAREAVRVQQKISEPMRLGSV